MKVIKTSKLSVITRCFEHQRELLMGVSVLAFIPLVPGSDEPPLLSELALWSFVPERLGPDAVLDAGIPKAYAEFLIHGSAFAPGRQAVTSVPVHARVGERAKSLIVYGDRGWLSEDEASEPKPFRTMPLSWERAYGGPSFARNPLGKGHDPIPVPGGAEGETVKLLPNLERPEQLLERAEDVVEPSCYAPLDIAWPQRAEHAGTYDQAWLEQLFPGFARDIDWRMFNLAGADQRLEGGEWPLGASYRLDNLHPEQPRLEGKLPGYRARAFITRELGPTPSPESGEQAPTRFEELPLRLGTLWLFPDAERAVLVFHGMTKLRTDDGRDIHHLLLAADRPEDAEQRDLDYYAQALAARLDPKQGAAASLREHELLPADMGEWQDEVVEEAKALVASENLIEANLHRRALTEHEAACAQLLALGLDPAKYAPPPPEPPKTEPPPLDELPGILASAEADAKQREAEAKQKMAEQRAALAAELRAAGLDPDALIGDPSAAETGPSGPPKLSAEGQRLALAALIEQGRAAGADVSELETQLADEQLFARWQQAEAQARDAYRQTAHFQSPAPTLEPERNTAARQAVLAAVRDRVDFSTLDFTGADLSGLDLRGANLRGACLESARLDGADLSQACLIDAVLAHASLVGAKLDSVDLSGANLGRADAREASLTRSKLERTVLSGTDLSRASLRGSRLVGIGLLLGTKLNDCDLGETHIDTLTLLGSEEDDGQDEELSPEQAAVIETVEVEGLRLADATLSTVNFIKLELPRLDASGAAFERCSFVGCTLDEAKLERSTFERVAFVESCSLERASLAEARLSSTNLRGTKLREASFEGAQLDGCDLSECDAHAARFAGASAQQALFVNTNLREATLSPTNLMGAVLKGATLVDADLRWSNLHGADLARVYTEGRVSLDGAVLTKVRIHPNYSEPPDDPSA